MMENQCWYYIDSTNQIHGPYNSGQMNYWYKTGYFKRNLKIIPASFMETLGSLYSRIYKML